MNTIHDRYFKIRIVIKNIGFLKLGMISLLIIFLLCSCNKDDGNVYDDIEVVNKGDNISENIDDDIEEVNQSDDKISEDIAYSNLEEALVKVKDEVKTLTGLDEVETSELFSIENTYYIKVKIHDLMLHYEYIYADSGESTAVTEYTDRDLNNIEEKISGDYYEIWRYENGDLKRILYNMEDVVY